MGHKCCGRKKNCDSKVGMDLIGKKFSEVDTLNVRMMRQDGQNLMGTCDFRPDRINVEVTNGVITAIIGNG